MRALARSFRRHFDGLRLILALFLPAVAILGALLTSPGWTFSPYGDDLDGVPSVAYVE